MVIRAQPGQGRGRAVDISWPASRSCLTASGTVRRVSDDLPFYSRGGLSFQYYFPLDGEYLIRVKTPANVDIGAPAQFYEMRMPVKAGLRTVGVTFPREGANI